jgi:hypothetical protein
LAYPSSTANANTIGTSNFNIKPIVAFFATPKIPKNNARPIYEDSYGAAP